MQSRGIRTIFWPPYSPDLNPIETLWDQMKDYIMKYYGGRNMCYDQLRGAVRKAWNAITQEDLNTLINEIGVCCQAVIDAEGRYTRF